MIKYKLNGETVDVPLSEQEQFEIDNPTAEKIEDNTIENNATKIDKDDVEIEQQEYIPQSTKIEEEPTPQSILQDPTNEADSSQNNQEQITETIVGEPVVEPIIEEESKEVVKKEVVEPIIEEEETVEKEEPTYDWDC